MSEAIIEETKTTTEVIDASKPIEGEPGDIIEKNGELFEVEAVEKEPTKSAEEEKGTEKEETATKTVESKKLEPSEEAPKVDTVAVKMKLLEKQVDLQKDLLKKANLSAADLRQLAPLADLKANIDRERNILANIDKELNPEEWATQKNVVTTLDGDIADKERNEQLAKEFSSRDNKDFIRREMKELSDKGFKFSDNQIEVIAKTSEKYLEGGKFTKDSIQKGLIDILGSETVTKMYEVGSERKVREDLKTATTKVTKSVSLTKLGISAKLTSFYDKLAAIKDPAELEKQLARLSKSQFAMYEKRTEQTLNK